MFYFMNSTLKIIFPKYSFLATLNLDLSFDYKKFIRVVIEIWAKTSSHGISFFSVKSYVSSRYRNFELI